MPVFLTNSRSRKGSNRHPALALDVVDAEHPPLVHLVDGSGDQRPSRAPGATAGPIARACVGAWQPWLGSRVEQVGPSDAFTLLAPVISGTWRCVQCDRSRNRSLRQPGSAQAVVVRRRSAQLCRERDHPGVIAGRGRPRRHFTPGRGRRSDERPARAPTMRDGRETAAAESAPRSCCRATRRPLPPVGGRQHLHDHVVTRPYSEAALQLQTARGEIDDPHGLEPAMAVSQRRQADRMALVAPPDRWTLLGSREPLFRQVGHATAPRR